MQNISYCFLKGYLLVENGMKDADNCLRKSRDNFL